VGVEVHEQQEALVLQSSVSLPAASNAVPVGGEQGLPAGLNRKQVEHI
jgi:hypothetical protein